VTSRLRTGKMIKTFFTVYCGIRIDFYPLLSPVRSICRLSPPPPPSIHLRKVEKWISVFNLASANETLINLHILNLPLPSPYPSRHIPFLALLFNNLYLHSSDYLTLSINAPVVPSPTTAHCAQLTLICH
jgi:hypothetical protein